MHLPGGGYPARSLPCPAVSASCVSDGRGGSSVLTTPTIPPSPHHPPHPHHPHPHPHPADFSSLDPELWSGDHVRSWLSWAGREYGLSELTVDGKHQLLGELSGKDLCRLTRQDFQQYTSPYTAEILLSHLHFLKGQRHFTSE